LTGKPKFHAECKSQPSETTGALPRKCNGGFYLRLTSNADIYAIAYIDCILNLKGKMLTSNLKKQLTGYDLNILMVPKLYRDLLIPED